MCMLKKLTSQYITIVSIIFPAFVSELTYANSFGYLFHVIYRSNDDNEDLVIFLKNKCMFTITYLLEGSVNVQLF